jgi:hypothetical protein
MPGAPLDPPDELLRELWETYGDRVWETQRKGTAPSAFWAFDKSVPEPFREHRPQFGEIGDDEPAGRSPDEIAAEKDLDERRRQWLCGHVEMSRSESRAAG